jgi:hypothetical protein
VSVISNRVLLMVCLVVGIVGGCAVLIVVAMKGFDASYATGIDHARLRVEFENERNERKAWRAMMEERVEVLEQAQFGTVRPSVRVVEPPWYRNREADINKRLSALERERLKR